MSFITNFVQSKYCMKEQVYNSDLNFIGSIPNYDLLFLALSKINHKDRIKEIEEVLVKRNLFDFRTEQARGRFFRMIKSTIYYSYSEGHRDLLASIFDEKCPFQNKNILLFWHLCLSNKLFYNISVNVYFKNYWAGRPYLEVNDVEAYIVFLKESDPQIAKWAEITIHTLASKYLTILRKLGMMEGRTKKQFIPVTLDNPTMVLFVYLIKSINPENTNFLDSKYFQLSFIDREAFVGFARKIANMDFWDLTFDGTALKFSLKHKPNTITHALFDRT